MPSRARRERQKQRSIQRKKRIALAQEAQPSQAPFMAAPSSAIPTGQRDPRSSWQPHSLGHSHPRSYTSTYGTPPTFGPSPAHLSHPHHNAQPAYAQPETFEWTPAYDSFLVLDVEATCMDIPRGTSFQHGPLPTTPLQSTVPLSSSSSSSASSQHPAHQHRLSVGGPGPGSFSQQHHLAFGPGSFSSSQSTTMAGTTPISSPNLHPIPNSPMLSPLTSASPLPSASPSQPFGRNALVDYPNEIIEFPVILMQWKDVPAEQGGRPGQRSLQVVDEFHSWVRPAWRPRLSRFCKELTGVKQSVIDAAPSWPEVMQNFLEFLRKHQLLADNQHPRARSSSIVSSASSSPMPFGAFSPASPPVFPMLPSPSPSSHHLPPLLNHAHHQHSHSQHQHSSFHALQASQAQQQPGGSNGRQPGVPTVDYDSLLMTTPLRHGVVWCTHGPYDLRDFAVKSCFLSGLRTPPSPPYWLRGPLIDIRKAAAEILLEERMLRLRSQDAREFAAREHRKAQLARAVSLEEPSASVRPVQKGAGEAGSADHGGKAKGTTTAAAAASAGSHHPTAADGDDDDAEWKRELELDHLLEAYERSVRAWPWYSAAISGQSGRFSANSAGHAVAHAERVKILPDGTIDGILYALGLGAFDGRKHSGLHDSRNLARILSDMSRRVGEVAAGRGTPGWETGRTDGRGVAAAAGENGHAGKTRGGPSKSNARLRGSDGVDAGPIEDGMASLALRLDEEENDDDAGGLDGSDDGSFSSDGSDDDDDHDDYDSNDGWIGADADGDADADADADAEHGQQFVSNYNDKERQRLCALQGQVFERACLLPNSFWKPLYLPTTVFSPVAATAARLLIWGTGPENRGGHGHGHGHGHGNGLGNGGGGPGPAGGRHGGHHRGGAGGYHAVEGNGPPVPARPIWMEGRRHAWMGPNPGQVFWNGPSIVDDADDADEEEEEEEDGRDGHADGGGGGSGSDSEDEDDDEVFRYPGVSADALDGTVCDLRNLNGAVGDGLSSPVKGRAGKSAGVGDALDSDDFTYQSSARSTAPDDMGLLLDDSDSERDRRASTASSSRSSSASRETRASSDDDRVGGACASGSADLDRPSTAAVRSAPIPIPIPIPSHGGGGASGSGSGHGASWDVGPVSAGVSGETRRHGTQTPTTSSSTTTTAAAAAATATGARATNLSGGGSVKTPSGQQTPVLGSSMATRA